MLDTTITVRDLLIYTPGTIGIILIIFFLIMVFIDKYKQN